MAGIRRTIHSLAAKLAPRDDNTQHSLELTAKSTDVVAALEHYNAAYRSFAAASRELYASIGSFYPPTGPLRPTLEALSKNGDGSPFSEEVVESRVEVRRERLAAVNEENTPALPPRYSLCGSSSLSSQASAL